MQHHADMHRRVLYVVQHVCFLESSQGSMQVMCMGTDSFRYDSIFISGRQSHQGAVCWEDCGWSVCKEAQLPLCGCMHLPAAHHDWSLCAPACGVQLLIGHFSGGDVKVVTQCHTCHCCGRAASHHDGSGEGGACFIAIFCHSEKDSLVANAADLAPT